MSNRSILFVACCAVASFPLSTALAQQFANLDIASAELSAWKQSFSNVRIIYHVSQRSDGSRSSGDFNNMMTTQWTWEEHGSVRHETINYWNGNVASKLSHGANIQQGKAFTTRSGQNDQGLFLAELKIVPVDNGRSNFTELVMPLFQLWFSARGKWLDEVMLQRAKDADIRSIDDCACLAVTIDDYRLYLDPTHSYLPRRADWIEMPDRAGWDFVVTEFGIADGIQFPKRGTFTFRPSGNYIQDWEVQECVFNLNLPVSTFDIPRPEEGTHVMDATTGNVFTYGKHSAKTHKGVQSEAVSSMTPVEAIPPTNELLLISVCLVIISLVLIGVGLLFLKRIKTDSLKRS